MTRRSRRKFKTKRNKGPIGPRPYEVVKMELRPMTNPLQQISVDERRVAFRDIGRTAKKEFEEKYPQLLNWFDEFDALYLLSYCCLYFLADAEGIDREAIDGRLDFYPNYLEILQALALSRPRSMSDKPMLDRATELRTLMHEVTNSFQLRSYDLPEGISDLENKKRFVLFLLQSETAAIRNPAYSHQSREYVKKLFTRLSTDFERIYKIDPKRLIDALYALVDRMEISLNLHLHALANFRKEKTWQKVWEVYVEEFPMASNDPTDSTEGRRIWDLARGNLDEMKDTLHLYSDLFLPTVFAFTLDEFAELYGDSTKTEELRKILDAWSYGFGDLKDEDPEHFILTNPVLKRPIVKLSDDAYFFPLTNIIGHILPMMMETLVRNEGDKAIGKYNKAKAGLLESEAYEHFRLRFPNAGIFRGSQWSDGTGSKVYENDLLLVIDRFAIVVECKSGAVDASARRGGEFRVVDTLKNLVVDAADQAGRFIRFLSENPGVHEFATRRGDTNVIDISFVEHYVPLSLTQEDLGAVSGNIRMCVEAGLIENFPDLLIPSMSIHDLEVILTILENEVEVLHYLTRRAQLEQQIRYLGDEGDLLAFYLDTGFNLGDAETSGGYSLNLMLKSKELDPFFIGRERGVDVEKPRLHLTKWWRDTIDYVIGKKKDYWTEIGFLLLNVPFEEQRGFERQFKTLSSKVKFGLTKERHNWITLETFPRERAYLIAGFPYVTKNRTERTDMMKHILQSVSNREHLQGLLCIGAFVHDPKYPYDVIAYTDGKTLE